MNISFKNKKNKENEKRWNVINLIIFGPSMQHKIDHFFREAVRGRKFLWEQWDSKVVLGGWEKDWTLQD